MSDLAEQKARRRRYKAAPRPNRTVSHSLIMDHRDFGPLLFAVFSLSCSFSLSRSYIRKRLCIQQRPPLANGDIKSREERRTSGRSIYCCCCFVDAIQCKYSRAPMQEGENDEWDRKRETSTKTPEDEGVGEKREKG